MQPETRIIAGDCLDGMAAMPAASVHCAITSPPYWNLRDYGNGGQIGLEKSAAEYVGRMVEVFRAVRRVLRDDGTLWLNLGDTYRGGQLAGIPWRVAFALQEDGWRLRQDIIWHKPNPMPESVRDRCTKAHEYVFMLTKSERYYYDAEAVSEVAKHQDAKGIPYATRRVLDGKATSIGRQERTYDAKPTRNRRSVWTITTKPYRGAHFAVMPPALVADCVKAGTSERGCCAACEAPLRRIVERTRVATRPGANTKTTGNAAREGNRDPLRHVTQTETTGWGAGCDCNAARIPCRVFDPFAGSGTTLAVAVELGRSGIGCELNPEYIALAEQRISAARSIAKPARQARSRLPATSIAAVPDAGPSKSDRA